MGQTYLAVNRVQVLTGNCEACGECFASSPIGRKVLVAVARDIPPCFFCARCGESILGRTKSQVVRNHFAWDWAVPLVEVEAGRLDGLPRVARRA